MEGILREWTHPQGKYGVFVTNTYVCYWRGHQDEPFQQVTLQTWLTKSGPRVTACYIGDSAAQEILTFVQTLVAHPH